MTVSILGCGWLGFPLARRLLGEGLRVQGATTTAQKLQELQAAGIKSYLLTYLPDRMEDPADFYHADTLFLNIPFSRQLTDPRFFLRQIESVVKDLKEGTVRFVVFAGTTGIYDDHNLDAGEDAPLPLRTERQRTLYEAEQLLLGQTAFATTVLRFGGLVGPGRPVGKFLAGKKDLKDPRQPVNLVHLDDCVEIICSVMKRDLRGTILNVVCDRHPHRESLYTKAAKAMQLPPPQFLPADEHATYKIVPNGRLKEILGYSFLRPDPMEFIDG